MAFMYWAVRQISTGYFLPEIGGRGYTFTKPLPAHACVPRLHFHAGSARRAMHAYCKGPHVRVHATGSYHDGIEPEDYVDINTKKARDKNDFEVVAVHLGVIGKETDLRDGRKMDADHWDPGSNPVAVGQKDPG